ncbi:hypothetical protein [Pseudoalteromonas luteoviolacea]|uniref:hypothetical protein n=1 Tax=Pseudoalteromonas luteoviolacea TaxID=43657 RepID=UPI00068A74AE|nr:hypothetical protein [Pseudoalteromonas luteoviolacea]
MNSSSTLEGTSWVFKLNINNQTDRDLTLTNSNLSWGYWYRDNEDDSAPVTVPARENVEALGVRAASGTWTGYECDATWKDETKGEGNLGTISLYIDVPFSGDNESSLDVNGLVSVEGWEDLPKSGHHFTRNITVIEVGNQLQVLDEDVQRVQSEFLEYLNVTAELNAVVQNWDVLKDVEAKNEFNILEYVPKGYMYPPKDTLLFRTDKHLIEKKLWQGIADPIYTSRYAKDTYVDEYFSVGLYFVNTNPRLTETIPAGVTKAYETTVEVTSAIKSTLTNFMSIRAALKVESKDPISGSAIASELESTYSVQNVLEESNSYFKREKQTIELERSENNRLFVQWLFSTAVCIYRKDKKGNVSLVSISEWGEEVIDQVYDY